jgi:galactokinase
MLDPNPTLEELSNQARAGLREAFAAEATVVAAAPGRVNLIGEHIDYCDGFVLPLAIERFVVIAAAPNRSRQARVATVADSARAMIELDSPQLISSPKWSNYLRGVVHGFQERGIRPAGFDACIVSSVPVGAGLSSSAALECATATLLEAFAGQTLPPKEKAMLCQKAEHDYANVPCGIMDQFASTFGKKDCLVLIDCRSGEPTLVPFADPGLTILVANTKVNHELSDGAYAARRTNTEDGLAILGKASWREVKLAEVEAAWENLGDPVNRRSRHVVGEIARTIAAAAALKEGRYEALGPLMAASHDSLRDDFEVSCRELDLLVDIARSIGRPGGVIGARMTGGGFGGSTVTLCESGKAAAIAAELHRRYTAQTGIEPEIFASRPSEGAHQFAIARA